MCVTGNGNAEHLTNNSLLLRVEILMASSLYLPKPKPPPLPNRPPRSGVGACSASVVSGVSSPNKPPPAAFSASLVCSVPSGASNPSSPHTLQEHDAICLTWISLRAKLHMKVCVSKAPVPVQHLQSEAAGVTTTPLIANSPENMPPLLSQPPLQ